MDGKRKKEREKGEVHATLDDAAAKFQKATVKQFGGDATAVAQAAALAKALPHDVAQEVAWPAPAERQRTQRGQRHAVDAPKTNHGSADTPETERRLKAATETRRKQRQDAAGLWRRARSRRTSCRWPPLARKKTRLLFTLPRASFESAKLPGARRWGGWEQ